MAQRTAGSHAFMTDEQSKESPSPARRRIGFIGLGRMGSAMAANLVADGYHVIAYLRRPRTPAEIAETGVEPVGEIADLSDCSIVISMVPDDTAAREVVLGTEVNLGRDGLAAALAAGAIHLSMSTISPAASAELALTHRNNGQGYVAAPVFGNPDAARARQLFIIAAGSDGDIERCRPILSALGQKTFMIGPNPMAANLVKLAGNLLTAATLEMLGEVFALVRKGGIAPGDFLDILTSTLHDSRVDKIYGGKMVAQQHAPGFALRLALKDVDLALAEAEASGVPMPVGNMVRDRIIAAKARGYDGFDWSVLGLVAALEAGLTPDSTKQGESP
jgi:3-hydroxyisobutyrate dehydrogenase-like beta-hydroxyacid dehydrogenase